MKKSLPAVSASYDQRFLDLQRSSGRILSASRTVLKTHLRNYIMYRRRIQGAIFYNYMNKMENTARKITDCRTTE